MVESERPLRIGLISYRSNPHCGGQGVYIRNLSRSLAELGHRVTVISGPPTPHLDGKVGLIRLPCLDLYNPEDPFRVPSLRELAGPVNFLEWTGVSTQGFPEPFTFGLRLYRYLRPRLSHFDILHDNQSLSYGVWGMGLRAPLVATIHHPITRDRRISVQAESSPWRKLKQLRWYSFIAMQQRVARTLPRILTVSRCAARDIARDFRISERRLRVVPNGIDTERFYPMPGIPREPGRIIVTNSADMPLKGLRHLLLAVHRLAGSSSPACRTVRLTVVGTPKKNGEIVRLIRQLGIGGLIRFTGRIDNGTFVREYARASVAAVPSIYEGFGLPAGEAMACGLPVVSTCAGALPEVVGDAGVLIPPGDGSALARAIGDLLENPRRAAALGRRGYHRVQNQFTWRRAAERTVAVYQEALGRC
jgi:glycosyltransferase involved in cell wall biosynthesis